METFFVCFTPSVWRFDFEVEFGGWYSVGYRVISLFSCYNLFVL